MDDAMHEPVHQHSLSQTGLHDDMAGMYMTTAGGDARAEAWEGAEPVIRKALDDEEDFVTMSDDPDSEGYIQAALWNRGILFRSYNVEVRKLVDGVPNHMRLKTRHLEDVMSALRTYFDGGDPVGPAWYDVTDEFVDDLGS